MSRFSTIVTWSISALTLLSIVFGMPLDAAAQSRRLVLPSSNVRNLPANSLAIAAAVKPSQGPVSVRRSSKATRASIVALAAVGGFFGGAFAGALLENTFAPCNCDDPGLQGVLIGAPVGAIAAGVLTFRFLPKP